MLKLNASYSKKVPAEGEYSSQSYHASIEVELPDGLTQDQLNEKIHETFAMVRDSVEAELHGNGTAEHEVSAPRNQQNQSRQGYRSGSSNYGKNKGQSQEDAPCWWRRQIMIPDFRFQNVELGIFRNFSVISASKCSFLHLSTGCAEKKKNR